MGDNIPYLPIKEFEAENLEEILETDASSAVGASKIDGASLCKTPPQQRVKNGDSYSENVDLVLEGMGLGQHIGKFRAHDIGLNILLHMEKKDLEAIGITSAKDQACFKKHLQDFNAPLNMTYKELYKIEEDLIMARNVGTHLEDINAHLKNLVQILTKNGYEDYFINSHYSATKVFDITFNHTMTQVKRMSAELFNGAVDEDSVIGACLKADNLELPTFMQLKLFDKNETRKEKKIHFSVRIATGLAIGISASVYIYRKIINK